MPHTNLRHTHHGLYTYEKELMHTAQFSTSHRSYLILMAVGSAEVFPVIFGWLM
jgi:hypothetical protein